MKAEFVKLGHGSFGVIKSLFLGTFQKLGVRSRTELTRRVVLAERAVAS